MAGNGCAFGVVIPVKNLPETLAELVAPLPEEDFLTLLRDRKLTHLRGAGRNRYSRLMNWKMLLDMIRRGQHPANISEFRLVMGSKMAPPDRWWKKDPNSDRNVVDLPNFLAYMKAGFNLSVTGLEAYAPHLKILSDNIKAKLKERIRIGAIVTTGKPAAFVLHFDPEDLIILQAEGRKRWKIFGPPVVNPVLGMPPVAVPSEDTLLFDEVLEPGDFLFVPSGNWHRCENQSERSLHIGVFFQPPNGIDMVKALTAQMLAEERFRLPLTRLGGTPDISSVEAEIKDRAIELVRELDLSKLLSDFEKQ